MDSRRIRWPFSYCDFRLWTCDDVYPLFINWKVKTKVKGVNILLSLVDTRETWDERDCKTGNSRVPFVENTLFVMISRDLQFYWTRYMRRVQGLPSVREIWTRFFRQKIRQGRGLMREDIRLYFFWGLKKPFPRIWALLLRGTYVHCKRRSLSFTGHRINIKDVRQDGLKKNQTSWR